MPADKPLLLIGLLHDYAARDFVDSGVLADLAREFRLAFVSSARLSLDLVPYGPVVAQHEIGTVRLLLYFLAAGLWHMAVKRRFELNRRNALRQATFGVGPRMERLIAILSLLHLSRPVAWVLRALLRLTAPRIIPEGMTPMAVLVYTSVRSYFVDDIVRDARRRGVPLLALANNWDNLNTKSFLEVPPYFGVWGEQGFLIARLMYRLPPHRIFVIGAPRFEIYRRRQPTRLDARAHLNLPADRRVLLFCGAGVSFEEVSLLQELDAAITDGRLPQDLLVVYKPHPLRFARVAEKPFDPSEYKHVVLAPETGRKLTKLDLYPDLLAAADTLISPFSSMIIEGARHGLPALCLGYNDPGHANHDWDRAAFNLHTYIIRHGDWAVVCGEREAFLATCQRLVTMIGDPKVAEGARAAAEAVWRTGRATVADRIAAAVRTLAAGGHADDSFVVSRGGAPRRLTNSASASHILAKDS